MGALRRSLLPSSSPLRVYPQLGQQLATNSTKRIILLHNIFHIPAARSNLISGIQLDKAGVVSTLGNNSIFLSVNNNTIIIGTISNDMYHLNLTVTKTNPPLPQLSHKTIPGVLHNHALPGSRLE